MPSVLCRPRILTLLIAAAGVSAVALAGAHAPAAAVEARASVGVTPTNVAHSPWFDMRVLETPVRFYAAPVHTHPAAVTAAAGILVDIDSNSILWEQNAHTRLPPASTTKILTALVALENFDTSREVTVSPQAVALAWDESRMGLRAGQVLTIDELLTGMLLVSGNDAANALADGTVGAERFVAAMNAQVTALGLRDSHFTTPVGLDEAAQRTSAYDLAAISAATVLAFPVFDTIVATRATTVAADATHPAFALQSIDTLLSMYPAATGIKPGWTAAAGYCEVGMAVRDGHRLLSVLLNAPYAFSQSRRLLDWGFMQEGLPSTLPAPTVAAGGHG